MAGVDAEGLQGMDGDRRSSSGVVGMTRRSIGAVLCLFLYLKSDPCPEISSASHQHHSSPLGPTLFSIRTHQATVTALIQSRSDPSPPPPARDRIAFHPTRHLPPQARGLELPEASSMRSDLGSWGLRSLSSTSFRVFEFMDSSGVSGELGQQDRSSGMDIIGAFVGILSERGERRETSKTLQVGVVVMPMFATPSNRVTSSTGQQHWVMELANVKQYSMPQIVGLQATTLGKDHGITADARLPLVSIDWSAGSCPAIREHEAHLSAQRELHLVLEKSKGDERKFAACIRDDDTGQAFANALVHSEVRPDVDILSGGSTGTKSLSDRVPVLFCALRKIKDRPAGAVVQRGTAA
ncbi:hypothetical protein DOTSEDRAFT_83209 [Dothistroma septosporum NZE10]|uniref:Uncharacterized protein n=1 Tax=Dothistroma septosporum (strain NZE10 / CBS 128990) TaxID=675120 RepID=M2Y2F9_DOTSN|nr:hypothetical protein DOTSEDRAFT_83209 [Dothistroma septosporum NZE10]